MLQYHEALDWIYSLTVARTIIRLKVDVSLCGAPSPFVGVKRTIKPQCLVVTPTQISTGRGLQGLSVNLILLMLQCYMLLVLVLDAFQLHILNRQDKHCFTSLDYLLRYQPLKTLIQQSWSPEFIFSTTLIKKPLECIKCVMKVAFFSLLSVETRKGLTDEQTRQGLYSVTFVNLSTQGLYTLSICKRNT